jgi:hypothetical protein
MHSIYRNAGGKPVPQARAGRRAKALERVDSQAQPRAVGPHRERTDGAEEEISDDAVAPRAGSPGPSPSWRQQASRGRLSKAGSIKAIRVRLSRAECF